MKHLCTFLLHFEHDTLRAQVEFLSFAYSILLAYKGLTRALLETLAASRSYVPCEICNSMRETNEDI